MIDSVQIEIRAGKGGNGCNSFTGKRFTRSWRPDGGGGGRGADIIIQVDKNSFSLERLRYKQCWRGENGQHGQANRKKGAQARPYIIKVPAGTIVRDIDNNLILRDLVESDEQLLAAQGGEGGKANARNRQATAGLPGEHKHLFLELKLVADAGIVGYPNAGKSSLLCRVSQAHPKIASYPFTTTAPSLGVAKFADFAQPQGLILVELPAVVKDAHCGKGLGLAFLRHAERARMLIHLIDLAALDGQDPVENYYNLNQELEFYNPLFAQKPQILVANKMDLPQAKTNLTNFCSKIKQRVYPISALNGQGIEELLMSLRARLS
ncbi:MAG: Obg family GTPase CgtA [Candidatus Omnitrophica bacterium]|nr:Obg family GTPase CgtA [Candidatus Omnitrophota bacterium]